MTKYKVYPQLLVFNFGEKGASYTRVDTVGSFSIGNKQTVAHRL